MPIGQCRRVQSQNGAPRSHLGRAGYPVSAYVFAAVL